MKTYSTKEAAARAAIHYITLHRWVTSGKVRPSQAIQMNGHKIWRWTDSDVEKVRKYKQGHYREGRGRKARSRR